MRPSALAAALLGCLATSVDAAPIVHAGAQLTAVRVRRTPTTADTACRRPSPRGRDRATVRAAHCKPGASRTSLSTLATCR